jgi:hypothetical protein
LPYLGGDNHLYTSWGNPTGIKVPLDVVNKIPWAKILKDARDKTYKDYKPKKFDPCGRFCGAIGLEFLIVFIFLIIIKKLKRSSNR